ncbi:MAG TPA: DUF3592 domain-containing protein [Thermoanaerobaculia bacterium]
MQRPFAPAPRRVPLSIRVANTFNMFSQIGWFLLAFSSIFVWVFVGNADLSFVTFRGEVAKAVAQVTKVEETNASEDDTKVMATHYQYSVAGQPFSGVAYSTGSSKSVGERVEIEYKPATPAQSRIPGMRRAMFSPFVLFVLIFPAVGAAFVYAAFRVGRRRNHALEHGLLAAGRLVEKNPTNMTVNDRPVWEMVFEFTARDGQKHRATANTTDAERLEDEHTEPLLYDPEDPSRAYVLDEAPARPEVNDVGELLGRPAAYARLVLPAIVILGNAAAYVLLKG